MFGSSQDFTKMGLIYSTYRSTPDTEKISSDESNDKLICGASSMQGWRVEQEDAHNCILDYDADTAFFAVYDGHGGPEVAQYCADKLPPFIKDTEAYKKQDVNNALIDGFLGFDATIPTPQVGEVLSELAGEKKIESDDEENVDSLYKEAAMPIEQVIEKYTACVGSAMARGLKKDVTNLLIARAKKEEEDGVGTSSSCSSEAGPSRNGADAGAGAATSDSCSDGVSSSSCVENEAKPVKETEKVPKEQKLEENGATVSNAKVSGETPDSSNSIDSNEADVKGDEELPVQNGEASESEGVSSSSAPQENGTVSKKGKGKALMKSPVKSPAKNLRERPKRNASQLYKQILDFKQQQEEEDSLEDTEDEEDKTFTCPDEESSDDEAEEGVNADLEENSDESSEEAGDAEEEEEEDDDDDDEEYEDEEEPEFIRTMDKTPGFGSGCTAVVALLKGNELYVANAGDSRCVVCRNGRAVEMSDDHKPLDEPEKQRILKAGGEVSNIGRVNGGLNLSRAIGDHAYKQNKELSAKEQMIIALPDVRTLTINPTEDEFILLACDGIWNYMSSQEVVDFVRKRIQEGREKLSQICEELFDHCLAPDTLKDGSCDNMTTIIVQLKKSPSLKRAGSPLAEESSSKMAKTEDNESLVDTTA